MSDTLEALPLSTVSDLAVTFTRLTDDEACELALRRYGLVGKVRRLATEKDDTYRFDEASGRRFILKVSNPQESALEIDLQVRLMRFIENSAPDLPVPRVLTDKDGEFTHSFRTSAGETRIVRLYSYLEGTPMDDRRPDAAGRYEIGELSAKLRLAMAGFAHPADQRIVAWDVKNLLSLSSLAQHVHVAEHRALVTEALTRFTNIAQELAQCRVQVVHNDFNGSNVLASDTGPHYAAGVIDFGDAVRTAIAIDASTAVMNQFPREFVPEECDDLFADSRDLLRGYLAHADLSESELRLIPHLAMARVVTRALLTTWRAALFPENSPYILRYTDAGWRQLKWFMQRSAKDISTTLL